MMGINTKVTPAEKEILPIGRILKVEFAYIACIKYN